MSKYDIIITNIVVAVIVVVNLLNVYHYGLLIQMIGLNKLV